MGIFRPHSILGIYCRTDKIREHGAEKRLRGGSAGLNFSIYCGRHPPKTSKLCVRCFWLSCSESIVTQIKKGEVENCFNNSFSPCVCLEYSRAHYRTTASMQCAHIYCTTPRDGYLWGNIVWLDASSLERRKLMFKSLPASPPKRQFTLHLNGRDGGYSTPLIPRKRFLITEDKSIFTGPRRSCTLSRNRR